MPARRNNAEAAASGGAEAPPEAPQPAPPPPLTEEALRAALGPLLDRLERLEARGLADPADPVEASPVVEEEGGPSSPLPPPPPPGGSGDGNGGNEADLPGVARAGAADAELEFAPFVEGNPYERPYPDRVRRDPHLWELLETPGCGDYRLALETKDKSFHEIKVLHAALSYGFDGLQDLGEALKGGPDALVGSEAVFRQLDRSLNTLSAVWDMLERRRGELEIMLKAKAPTATEEDRAAAEHIKVLGRGFAGGATIRHPTLAKELEALDVYHIQLDSMSNWKAECEGLMKVAMVMSKSASMACVNKGCCFGEAL